MTKVNSITAAYLDTSFYHPVRDPVWGSIMLSDGFKSLVSSPVLQKMNRIRQLGPTYLVYPGAVHTRFIHSLGVYHIGYRMIRRLLTFDSCPTVTVQDVNAFLAACLETMPRSGGEEAAKAKAADSKTALTAILS